MRLRSSPWVGGGRAERCRAAPAIARPRHPRLMRTGPCGPRYDRYPDGAADAVGSGADDSRPADPRPRRARHGPDARRLRRAHGADRRARRLRHRLHLRLLGVSAARLGEPDFGFLTQSEMADAARAVCRVSNAPVIVDADTGYGNAVNVMRTVRDFQDAGAAGVFLEDQVWPKKCGHFAGQAGDPDRRARGEDPRRGRRARRARPVHRRPHRRAPAARPRRGDRALPRLQGGGRRRAVRRGAAVGRGARADRRRRCRRRSSRT